MKFRAHLSLMLVATLFAAAHLTFEHFNGGVQSHHLLNRADLPEVSNAFGLLVLPGLAWLLGMRVHAAARRPVQRGRFAAIGIGFVASLLYAAALAVGFTLQLELVTTGLFFGLFAVAVLLPIYRAECVLGFVVGMTFTIGAVLPALIAGVFALLSALLHPLLRWLLRAIRRAVAGQAGQGTRTAPPPPQ